MLSAYFDFGVLLDNASGQLNENSDYLDQSNIINGIHETSPDQGHTLPILKKIIDLSTKVQVNFECWFVF